MTGRTRNVMWAKRLSPAWLLVGLLSVGCENAKTTSIAPIDSPWAYRWGDSPRDDMGHPTFTQESNGWNAIAPFAIPRDGDGSKLLWLRLPLPEGEWRDPTLHLGDARNAYEVWTDTNFIGTAGIVRPDGRESPAGIGDYFFSLEPKHLGRPIYLLLQASDADIPTISRFAEIGERGDLVEQLGARGLPVLLLSGFLLGFGLIAFIAALFGQSIRLFIAFGIFEVIGATLSTAVGDGHALIHPDQTLWYRVTFFSGFALIWSLGFFIDAAIVEGRRPWFRRLISIIGVLSLFLAPVALTSIDRLLSVQNVIIVLLLVSLLPSAFVVGIEARNRNVDAWIFLVGIVLLIGLSAYDVTPMLVDGQMRQFLLPWAVLALTLCFLAITARRFVEFYRRLEHTSAAVARQNEQSGELARELTGHARHLLSAVGTLNEARTDQGNQLASQAISLQETQVTAEEIRQLSQRASTRAQTARELTDTMTALVHSGDVAIETSRTTLDAIRQESSLVAQRVTALGERMREIASIVGTVSDIARRSNMLALNAAVEAVRSGEHGKGFAIVSREMRALADQSIAATKNITRLIEEVALDTESTEAIASGAAERVDAGVQLLQASQSELRELTQTASTTTQHVVEIARAIEQQHAGISQLTVAVHQLHDQMEGALVTLTRAEQAAGSVDEVARRMSSLG